MRAYRSGELYLALASFGVAIDLDPGSPDSYIDRGIVFHRLGDLKRALSDVAEAKRLEDLNRKQSASRIGTPDEKPLPAAPAANFQNHRSGRAWP